MLVKFKSENSRRATIRLLDPWIIRSSGLNEEVLRVERKFHKKRCALTPNMETILESVLYDMDILDSKSAALLTHISVIIAALAFSLNMHQQVSPYAVYFVIAEIVAYTLCSMFLLRCVNFMGQPKMYPNLKDERSIEDDFMHEMLLRKCVYVSALRYTYVLTAILLLGVLVEAYIAVWSFHNQ